MIEKWTAQGSMAGIGGGHARPQVPTGGVGGESSKQPEDQYLRSSTPIGLKAWRIILYIPLLPFLLLFLPSFRVYSRSTFALR